jgi:hypothetical protein
MEENCLAIAQTKTRLPFATVLVDGTAGLTDHTLNQNHTQNCCGHKQAPM